MTLEDCHPSIYSECVAGNFSVKETACLFSALTTDQAPEQNNAAAKGEDGAV